MEVARTEVMDRSLVQRHNGLRLALRTSPGLGTAFLPMPMMAEEVPSLDLFDRAEPRWELELHVLEILAMYLSDLHNQSVVIRGHALCVELNFIGEASVIANVALVLNLG